MLTGCRKGTVPARPSSATARPPPARELDALIATFGRHNVVVELCDHGDPLDSHRNDALAQLAVRAGVDVVATTNAHYATPARRPLATAMAAVRARRSLDELDPWLPACAGAHLRSGDEQARRFARWPGAVERAAELGPGLRLRPAAGGPAAPAVPVPRRPQRDGLPPPPHRRGRRAALRRRGATERVPGAYRQIEHELALIEQLGFPGYFLVVWDIVDFCRRSNIYCQGRGSAANSAVCYALGITNADAVSLGLLFERFLSPGAGRAARHRHRHRVGPARGGDPVRLRQARPPPRRPGGQRHHLPRQVVDPRRRQGARLRVRPAGRLVEAGRRLGRRRRHRPAAGRDERPSPPTCSRWPPSSSTRRGTSASTPAGMVICDRPIVEVCPVEWARLTGSTSKSKTLRGDEPIRTVLQWDKDDCAAIGLVKFDLLGLGMLEVLHGCIDLVREVHGDVDVDLATIPQEDEVYDMLCRADSVGVFQVESRAQMATLPRLRPREFYDLVVEVALIRPGPIQGGSVHPYIRRRNGLEEVTYLHPLLERSLKKTLGVPLFQEQLMQMAIDVGGFSPGEADMLRQAMGSKRSHERMERLHQRFADGAAERGVARRRHRDHLGEAGRLRQLRLPREPLGELRLPRVRVVVAEALVPGRVLRRAARRPADGLLRPAHPRAGRPPPRRRGPHPRPQRSPPPPPRWKPLGARRRIRGTDAAAARRQRLEAAQRRRCGTGRTGCGIGTTPEPAGRCGGRRSGTRRRRTWGTPGPAVRLGISYVRGIGLDLAAEIAAGRPYADPEDLARRVPLTLPQLEALATAGAFDCFGMPRREAIWAAGAVAQMGTDRHGAQRLPGIVTGVDARRRCRR